MKKIWILLLIIPITACDKSQIETLIKGRWYTQTQLNAGKVLFQRHCSTCHGIQAQGSNKNWRKRIPDNSFPPPPLNGSAHAWHHPISTLLTSINQGGAPFGGKMPPFKDVLSLDEQRATIAYFQSFWTDVTCREWQKLGGPNK
jgi:mono/diheme cytochrome c family protein